MSTYRYAGIVQDLLCGFVVSHETSHTTESFLCGLDNVGTSMKGGIFRDKYIQLTNLVDGKFLGSHKVD